MFLLMNVLAVYIYYYATGSQNKHLILIDCVCFQSLSLIQYLMQYKSTNSYSWYEIIKLVWK